MSYICIMMASSVIVPNTVMSNDYWVLCIHVWYRHTSRPAVTDNNNLFFDEDIQEKNFYNE